MKIEINDEIVDKIVKGRNEITKKGASIDDFLTRNEYNALIGAMDTAQQKKRNKCVIKKRENAGFVTLKASIGKGIVNYGFVLSASVNE